MSLTRRSFLRAAAGAGLGGCAVAPAAGGDRIAVIDTHTHFYDPTRPQGVPWPDRGDAKLYRRVMPEDYLAQKVPRPVSGTVVVEASPWVEDNQWLLDLAARSRFIVGVVGNLRLGAPGFAEHLDRFAANPLFRGIRLRDREIEAIADREALLGDLRRLAGRGLSLDVNVPFRTLAEVERLADEIPDLRLIINHVALARIDGKNVEGPWSRRVRALAERPNVFMKISGLVEATGRREGAPREVDFYRPWIDLLWDAFGEDRLVYGSNWPVCEKFAPLEVVQGIIEDYFSPHGAGVLEKVFSENARAAYRWIPRGERRSKVDATPPAR